MSLRVEIPQCCVCYEPFRKNVALVRPVRCGHVLCRPCAEVMKNLKHKCPFHCPSFSSSPSTGNVNNDISAKSSPYEGVYMDFGVHDVLPFLLTASVSASASRSMSELVSHDIYVSADHICENEIEEEENGSERESSQAPNRTTKLPVSTSWNVPNGHAYVSRAEVETVMHLLSDLAKSDPRDWLKNKNSIPSSREEKTNGVEEGGNGNRNNCKGLLFLRASRLVQKAASGVEGNDIIKDLLSRLSLTLADLKDLFDSTTSILTSLTQTQTKLESSNASLHASLHSLRESLKEKEAYYITKLDGKQTKWTEKEGQMRLDLGTVSKKLKEEKDKNMDLEGKLERVEGNVEQWKRSSLKYRRKYEHERNQNELLRKGLKASTPSSSVHPSQQAHRNEDRSDDSLEIIGIDGDHLDPEGADSDAVKEGDDDDDIQEVPSPPSSSSMITNSHRHTCSAAEPSSSLSTLVSSSTSQPTSQKPRSLSSSATKFNTNGNVSWKIGKTNSFKALPGPSPGAKIEFVVNSDDQQSGPPKNSKSKSKRIQTHAGDSLAPSNPGSSIGKSTSPHTDLPKTKDEGEPKTKAKPRRPHSKSQARVKQASASESNRIQTIDPKLLELCPDILQDARPIDSNPSTYPSQRGPPRSITSIMTSNATSKAKKATTSTGMNIPTNPLATRHRHNTDSLHFRERKKPRLTLGTGGDV